MKITGIVEYVNIGPGCWGITDKTGKQFRPVNFPDQLKTPGRKVSVVAKAVKEEFSIFMWGTPVRITSFST